MATEFNINDFIGGGSSSNFGNFGDTSSPADLFSLPPSAPTNNQFSFNAFEGASFNSPNPNSIQEFNGSFLGQTPSFAELQANLQSFQPTFSPSTSFLGQPQFSQPNSSANTSFLGQPQSFEQNAGQLLRNIREANTSLGEFLNRPEKEFSSQPIISSTPEPGLEPFNRFNTTTGQFETLFGNAAARLPSAETFVKGQTGFDDTDRFLQSVRDQAQMNATNYLGQPVTNDQMNQAANLAKLMGTDGNFESAQGDGGSEKILRTAEYGDAFNNVSAEDLNKLLNMRTSQQAAADNQRRIEQMKTDPSFQRAIAEREKAQQESRAAFDRASDLQQQELENRIPFNASFNYDDQGNKVLAGESARAAGQGPDITQAEARDLAKASSRYATDAEKARGMVVQDRINKRIQERELNESAQAVKNFLTENNVGENLSEDSIKSMIKVTGSPQAAVRAIADLQKEVPETKIEKATDSIDAMANFGAEIESPNLFTSKGEGNETLMLGLNQNDGRWGYVTKDGVFKPVNINEWVPTTSSDIKSARDNATKLQQSAFKESNAIGVLERFRKSRELSEEGFASFVTDLKGKIQNFVGQDLDPQAMRNAVSKAGFQALLGRIRIDVLGPGVLTEIDAQRLIEALGGYGVTSDRETTLALVDEIIASKRRGIDGSLTVYDQYRTQYDVLEEDLPFLSMDNIERVRQGDLGRNINANDPVDLNKMFNP